MFRYPGRVRVDQKNLANETGSLISCVHSGFSLRKEVTSLSGHGIGLSAVADVIEKKGDQDLLRNDGMS